MTKYYHVSHSIQQSIFRISTGTRHNRYSCVQQLIQLRATIGTAACNNWYSRVQQLVKLRAIIGTAACSSSSMIKFDRRSFGQSNDYFASQKKKAPFSMAIGNWELMHERFPKHSRMGTARMK